MILTQTQFAGLQMKGSPGKPKKDGIYVLADANARHVVRIQATLMGNMITTEGKYRGANVRTMNEQVYWWGPFQNGQAAQQVKKAIDDEIKAKKEQAVVVTTATKSEPVLVTSKPEQEQGDSQTDTSRFTLADVRGNEDLIGQLKTFAARKNSPKGPREVIQQIIDQL